MIIIKKIIICTEQMRWTRERRVELLKRLQVHELRKRDHHPHSGDHGDRHLHRKTARRELCRQQLPQPPHCLHLVRQNVQQWQQLFRLQWKLLRQPHRRPQTSQIFFLLRRRLQHRRGHRRRFPRRGHGGRFPRRRHRYGRQIHAFSPHRDPLSFFSNKTTMSSLIGIAITSRWDSKTRILRNEKTVFVFIQLQWQNLLASSHVRFTGSNFS
ncbi:hypothetical protein V8G54_033394 [Vigna mungo]|uniref:Uncharacterized protein n=1 Tax=Vigna mungo TaxID=3915 RepID=A0AAQ3MN73_VIGMU